MFKDYDDLYLPKMYTMESSKRTIMMEFVEGTKIDNVKKLKEEYGDPMRATSILSDIFARMIFMHGHVHCDAHPGNIFVRPNPKDKKRPQIVLIDHGFYCSIDEGFRK